MPGTMRLPGAAGSHPWLATLLVLIANIAFTTSATADSPWMPRQAHTTMRVLSWNISRQAFFRAGEKTQRLLAAMAPDILLLDEMPKSATPESIATFLDQAITGSPWHVVIGQATGGLERGSISSRWPLTRAVQFDGLHYRPSDARSWIEASGEHAERLRQTLPLGVAVAGAIANVEGMHVLLVSFDLQCCGDSPDAWEELRRLAEAQLIRGAIEATLAATPIDAVIIGGDANNVQGDEVLRILQGSPSDLADAPARREDGSNWTWDGRGTPFPSKKIDHILHSARLDVSDAFVFDPEGWPVEWLDHYGVQRDWAGQISAHRPVVVDFSLRDKVTELHTNSGTRTPSGLN